ncbi:unnamed protein product [Gordionus sp. m RMFG-2023]
MNKLFAFLSTLVVIIVGIKVLEANSTNFGTNVNPVRDIMICWRQSITNFQCDSENAVSIHILESWAY